MCRFVCYIGKPIVVDELVLKPKHSLVIQSMEAVETDKPHNADGFGIGWYDQRIDSTPAVFRSILPAWNNLNLINLTGKLLSDCFFAHVRAASIGGVSEYNCHPFQRDDFLFMHNGLIRDFDKLIRLIRHELSDESYQWLQGQTDSEHFFALFSDYYRQEATKAVTDSMFNAFIKTVQFIQALKEQHDVDRLSIINAAITDGKSMIVTRYSSMPAKATNSLYYSYGHDLKFHGDTPEMVCGDGERQSVIVASERLTENTNDWHEVPINHVLLIDEQLNTALRMIRL